MLELKVTPTITADGRVFLNLDVKKDAMRASLVPNPGGGFDSAARQARDHHVSAASTMARRSSSAASTNSTSRTDITKVPFLGDLPGIGAFFRDTQKSNQKAEMLIFVTPKILDENLK